MKCVKDAHTNRWINDKHLTKIPLAIEGYVCMNAIEIALTDLRPGFESAHTLSKKYLGPVLS